MAIPGRGMIPRVTLCVVSWASLEQARPGRILTMVKEVVQHCFTILSALVMNRTYGIAVTLGGVLDHAAIIGMLVLTVINTSGIQPSILDLDISMILWCLCEFLIKTTTKVTLFNPMKLM